MPEHTSFLTYLAAKLFANWDANVANLKCAGAPKPDLQHCTAMGEKVTSHSFEPVLASLTIFLVCILFAVITRSKITKLDEAIVPEKKLTIRTLVEYLIEVFYGTMKEMMGAKRAKRYLPLIGTCAMFIFFSNIATLIPGFTPPTSSWSITLGCALFVFVAYNYYGFKENGFGYLKHFMGPILVLAPLIFVIEVISNFIRPITLSIRLMLNMAVDHLVLGIVLAMVPMLVPLPLMVLGTLVAVVQTFVFCLLSSIYVSMATEHEH
ncbi:MAG: F0F1 ATP synthase subunit A [Polyangiales bacterium]